MIKTRKKFVTTIDNTHEGNGFWNFKFWASDFDDAQKHFITQVDQLIMEIPTKDDGFTPDWDNAEEF